MEGMAEGGDKEVEDKLVENSTINLIIIIFIITQKTFTKKGDVGMAKHFSKKYGNKGRAFDYPVSAI